MLWRHAALLVVFARLCAAIGGCTSDNVASSSKTADAGLDDTAVGDGICPAVAPDGGAVCLLPTGTACAYGACNTSIAECTGGYWRYGGNPPGPPCPQTPPASESACPPCWPESQTCAYGSNDCSQPDASVNRTIASCAGGTWTLAFYPCADASTDVQGDGGRDRD